MLRALKCNNERTKANEKTLMASNKGIKKLYKIFYHEKQ